MKSYRVLKDAERDLDGIFEYWAERASVGAADRLIDAITERFWILASTRRRGTLARISVVVCAVFRRAGTWCITARGGTGWRFFTYSTGRESGRQPWRNSNEPGAAEAESKVTPVLGFCGGTGWKSRCAFEK